MILAVLQARVSSTRLPGKVLLPILGAPMLARQIERVRRSRRIDRLVVATGDGAEDDAVAGLCEGIGVECFRGSLHDVLDRFYRAAAPHRPRHVVRLTGDCPLADWTVIDRAVDFHLEGGYDYASNALEPSWPDGLDVEVVRFEALETAWREARLPSEREHVLPFVHRRPERFRLGSLRDATDLSGLRWTVDEPADLAFVSRVYEALYPADPAFGTEDVLRLLRERPEISALNRGFERNEGMRKSEAADAAFLHPETPGGGA